MLKSLVRSYSSYQPVKHTHTHKVFNKLFKNKIDTNPSNSSADNLRSEMALYLINNKNRNHRNHPELLFELQQHHSNQYKKLEKYKEKVEYDISKVNSSDNNLLNSLFLVALDHKASELLHTHRRQIRKVDDVKHQNPDFWSFKLPEE